MSIFNKFSKNAHLNALLVISAHHIPWRACGSKHTNKKPLHSACGPLRRQFCALFSLMCFDPNTYIKANSWKKIFSLLLEVQVVRLSFREVQRFKFYSPLAPIVGWRDRRHSKFSHSESFTSLLTFLLSSWSFCSILVPFGFGACFLRLFFEIVFRHFELMES